jgi:hypothetical protein
MLYWLPLHNRKALGLPDPLIISGSLLHKYHLRGSEGRLEWETCRILRLQPAIFADHPLTQRSITAIPRRLEFGFSDSIVRLGSRGRFPRLPQGRGGSGSARPVVPAMRSGRSKVSSAATAKSLKRARETKAERVLRHGRAR